MSSEYVVPSMVDVNAAAGTNGYRMVSTFSGAGGSCLGAKLAGFDVVWASEFVPAAREVYQANHPGTPVDERDIRNVTGADIMNATGINVGELDLFEGSPPCASFSSFGNREKDWGKVKQYSDRNQQTDDLFFEYVRLVGEIQPKVFVAENVAGLVQGVAKGYFKQIFARLVGCGYQVEARILDASRLGVPQTRSRLFFVGLRNDLNVEYRWPTPHAARISLQDALPDVAEAWAKQNYDIRAGGQGYVTRRSVKKPCGAILASGAIWGTGSLGIVGATGPRAGRAVGASYQKQTGCPADNLRRFSIDEAMRLQSFPADFEMTGTYAQQWERIGRSVPPLMMKAVMDGARKVLDQCAD